MRSCNERTILHCLESYLYYVILVNKKIFSEEWNEGEKKIDNIYIHCRKYKIYIDEFWRVFLTYFAASGNELYIFRQCTYIVSIAPKKLSNCLKRAKTSVVLIVFDCVLCEVRAYKFISINPVTVSYRRSTWIKYQKKDILVINQIQMYSKKISGQCNVTTRIEQVQDKKNNINWAAKKYY